MKNTTKIYFAIIAIVIIAEIVAYFCFLHSHIIDILHSRTLSFLIFSIFNLSIIVLLTIIFLHISKKEYEENKIEKENVLINEKAKYDNDSYISAMRKREKRENFMQTIEFFKYLNENTDWIESKADFFNESKFEDLIKILLNQSTTDDKTNEET